jgi:hypothetical protein
VRPPDCPDCDRAVERSAVLAVQLKKAAGQLHLTLGHQTVSWVGCTEPPCPEHAAVLRGE